MVVVKQTTEHISIHTPHPLHTHEENEIQWSLWYNFWDTEIMFIVQWLILTVKSLMLIFQNSFLIRYLRKVQHVEFTLLVFSSQNTEVNLNYLSNYQLCHTAFSLNFKLVRTSKFSKPVKILQRWKHTWLIQNALENK